MKFKIDKGKIRVLSSLALCGGLMIASQALLRVGMDGMSAHFYLALGMMLMGCLSLYGAYTQYHAALSSNPRGLANTLHAENVERFVKAASHIDVAIAWLAGLSFAMIMPNALSAGYRAGFSGLPMAATVVVSALFVLIGYKIAVHSLDRRVFAGC